MSGKTDLTKRRRTLIVDAPLQRAFVVDVAMIPALALGVTTVIVAAFCHRLRLEAEQTDAELSSLVPLLVSFVAFTVASAFAIVYQAVRISNRVVGPQVNMRHVINRVIAGEHGARVRLRKGDFMLPAADDINRLVEHFTHQTVEQPTSAPTKALTVDDVPAPSMPPTIAHRGAMASGSHDQA